MRIFGLLVLLSGLLAVGVWLGTIPGLDSRGLLTQRHEHEIGADTVGVRLIGMTEFEVLAPGDTRWGRPRTGELRDMSVSIGTDEEGSTARGEGATGLRNITNPDRDHLAYVSIDRGDIVGWNRSASWSDTEVWVNMDRNDVLRLRVAARDLDCWREFVCDRVSDGFYITLFQLPVLPEVLPETCEPNTTFAWIERDGGWGFETTDVVEERREHRPVLRPANGALCFTAPIIEE